MWMKVFDAEFFFSENKKFSESHFLLKAVFLGTVHTLCNLLLLPWRTSDRHIQHVNERVRCRIFETACVDVN